MLEVVLALVIFAAAATIIGMGLNSSISSVDRLRMSAHAADLATTVFTELQVGIRSIADTGPEPFAPERRAWTWEIAATPWGDLGDQPSSLMRVEVIIRQEDEGFVHRATQVIKIEPAEATSVLAANGGGSK